METLSVFEGERKRHKQWIDTLKRQLGEVTRDVLSPLAPSLVDHLNLTYTDAADLHEEYEIRLFLALEFLGSIAELIHPTPTILASSQANILIEEPTDNLILASILDHSKNYPSETKILLSENRRDFDINLAAKRALEESGIGYFADASRFLDWQRVQPGP